MALPVNLTTVTVTGTYIDIAGNPIAGQVKFTPRAVLKNVTSNIILINSTITVTLNSSGAFSQALVATDDIDAAPIGFTYRVEEAFIGGRTFDMLLPAATVGGTIDLADVSPAAANDGTSTLFVTVAEYDALEARVDAVEALATTADALFGDLTDELDAAIAASDSHVALINSYITAVGNITDNKGSINSLLFPAKAS
jgi:hypothetical protein